MISILGPGHILGLIGSADQPDRQAISIKPQGSMMSSYTSKAADLSLPLNFFVICGTVAECIKLRCCENQPFSSSVCFGEFTRSFWTSWSSLASSNILNVVNTKRIAYSKTFVHLQNDLSKYVNI